MTPGPHLASLPAHQLDAFQAIVEAGGFSRAAKRLGVTQPALSQRIQQLEGGLGYRLFVRSPSGISVTEAGARLLRYCEAKRALESEVLEDLEASVTSPGSAELSGSVRVAAYSSTARSCVLPSLAPLFRENRLVVDVRVLETRELASVIAQGTAEVVIIDRVLSRPDVEHEELGHEELVLVESAHHPTRADVYLDHDAEDETTFHFLAQNGVKSRWVKRSFFNDIYGVLDAAALGFGRAVVAKHLLPGYRDKLRVVPKMHAPGLPVVLHWFRQPSYTRAHEAVRIAIARGVPPLLGRKEERKHRGKSENQKRGTRT